MTFKKPKSLSSKRTCGGCTLCCTLLGVVEFDKPPNQHCEFERPGGCACYAERPGTCKVFHCQWLLDKRIAEELRPDRSHVVLWAPDIHNARVVQVNVDPDYPEAHREGMMGKLLDLMVDVGGLQVTVVIGEKRQALITIGEPVGRGA